MNTLWKFLILAICLYAGVAALINFRQSSLIFYADVAGRGLATTPQRIGLAFEDVEPKTEDKVRLHGWFIATDNARGSELFFHGNAGSISQRLDSIATFNRMSLKVFIFDYRGYGRSQGRVTEIGTWRDAEDRLVFDAAPANKQFLEIRGGHNDGFIVTGRAYPD